MTNNGGANRPHRDLYAAIGRVASASARLETTLRLILNDLAGMNDIAWILFEGQSTDSLISNCRTILWFAGGGDTIWIWNSDQRMRLTKLLDECTELRRGRNVVIHGTWSDFCEYEERYSERFWECFPGLSTTAPAGRLRRSIRKARRHPRRGCCPLSLFSASTRHNSTSSKPASRPLSAPGSTPGAALAP